MKEFRINADNLPICISVPDPMLLKTRIKSIDRFIRDLTGILAMQVARVPCCRVNNSKRYLNGVKDALYCFLALDECDDLSEEQAFAWKFIGGRSEPIHAVFFT